MPRARLFMQGPARFWYNSQDAPTRLRGGPADTEALCGQVATDASNKSDGGFPANMSRAAKGNKVKVHYVGTLEDGTVFDSSRERDPLTYVIGSGQMLRKFEYAVEGLEPGQSAKITLSPEEGYGERMEELVLKYDRAKFPKQIPAVVGEHLSIRHKDGGMLPVVITEVTDKQVTVDGNHPLAGKTINFDIELVEIVG